MPFTAGYVVNEGTLYQFTVSNETISEMVQQEGGITNADIQAYCYSALIDSRVHTLHAHDSEEAWDGSAVTSFAASNCAGIFNSPLSGNLTDRSPAFNTDILDSNDVCYQRNFLIWEGTIYPNTENEKTGWFLVMDMVDIKRWYVNFDNNGYFEDTVTSSVYEETPEGYVWPGYNGKIYGYSSASYAQGPVMHCDNNNPQLNPNTNIRVCNVLDINDELWIGALNPSTHGPSSIGASSLNNAAQSLYAWYWGASCGGQYLAAPSAGEMSFQRGSLSFGAWPDYSSAPDLPGCPRANVGTLGFNSYFVCTDEDSTVINLAGGWGQQNYASSVGVDHSSKSTNPNIFLKWSSWGGLLFEYDGVMYKPIIEDGVVVGYSSDMDEPSEFDDMSNVTGNNISPTPPVGPVDPDTDDEWHGIDFGGASLGGGGAFAKLYYMTSTELANLRTWMNSNNPPEGFDPMAQIIGLSQLPVALSGSAPENIMFINNAAIYSEGQNRVVDTGVATQRSTGAPISFNLGSVNIKRRMKERGEPYLDYSCGIELYLPLVGTFSLDTQAVMDRTIHAAMTLDAVNGTIAAYAWVEKNGQKLPVAYGSSSVAVDLPIAAQQYSMSKAALNQANAQFYGSLLSGALNAMIAFGGSGTAAEQAGDAAYLKSRGVISRGATKNAELTALGEGGKMAAAQGSSNVVSGFADWGRSVRQISYGNNTAIAGSFGGSFAQWSYPFTAYVKIVRPKFKKPSNYKHTQAVPCVEAIAVGNCSGLIKCIGVDTSSITNATSTERDAIAAALCNGVYAGN